MLNIVASESLAEQITNDEALAGKVYPDIEDIRTVSKNIAIAGLLYIHIYMYTYIFVSINYLFAFGKDVLLQKETVLLLLSDSREVCV